MSRTRVAEIENNSLEMFDRAAELFRVMAAPMRLRVINALCDGEKNVSELLVRIETTQPNMSQHLSMLYKAGVLSKRREGAQIYYRIADKKIVNVCKAICLHVADVTEFWASP
jgi:DNA-binding transcriptional ArsR family regulator